MEYDAIITGGSFAGLAAAREIKGEVLLIDRKEIGSGQTSACGTFLKTLQDFNCESSAMQTFNKTVFHLPEAYEVGLVEPLCTFDYHEFCTTLADNVGARILKAKIKGMTNGAVVTDEGEFRSRCVLDCTGWRAVLASTLRPGYVRREKLGSWIETVAEYFDEALHVYAVPEILPGGVAWIFPIGGRSRIGIGSYAGTGGLLPALKKFLKRLGLVIGEVHGNFIPYGLREPIVGDVFVVGDAAGHALPVTAEGIRKSLEYGRTCGRIVQRVVDEETSLKQGLEEYKTLVEKSRQDYEVLEAMQQILLKDKVPNVLLKAFSNGNVSKGLQEAYLSI